MLACMRVTMPIFFIWFSAYRASPRVPPVAPGSLHVSAPGSTGGDARYRWQAADGARQIMVGQVDGMFLRYSNYGLSEGPDWISDEFN